MLTNSWFIDCCKEITKRKSNIWVAYSGGVDSHVLLRLAATNLNNVHAVHINHNLSNDDAQWQQHCEQVCSQLNIPLKCITVDAQPKKKQSPEQAARLARRKAWQAFLTADDVLFVAHHAEDQAETILYRLFRGTGPKGLCGMKAHSKIGGASIFRPLLNISKQTILNYAQQNKLNWSVDETNWGVNYSRNYIRNIIMPLVSKRWPAATTNINRAGDLCAQLLQVVDPVIAQKLTLIYGANNSELELAKLADFPEFIQIELLRAWLQLHDLTPSLQQINILRKQVIAAKIDASPKLVIGHKLIRRSNNKLYIIDCEPADLKDGPAPEVYECAWDLISDLQLPNLQVLSPSQLPRLKCQQVVVKLGAHGRKAKKVFQKHNIPPWERNKYPLIFADGKLVCIIGLWISSNI